MLEPILRDFPDHFETDRLVVRCPMPGDGPMMNEAVRESLDSLRPWMPWAQTMPSIEESEQYVRRARARFLLREDLPLSLFLREDGRFVGGAGLHRIDWQVPRFEVGYWCRASLQRGGLITEAVTGMTRFAFDTLGARRMEIRCDSRNDRSRRVAERARYALEATMRNQCVAVDGTLRDTLVYALTPDGYKERYR